MLKLSENCHSQDLVGICEARHVECPQCWASRSMHIEQGNCHSECWNYRYPTSIRQKWVRANCDTLHGRTHNIVILLIFFEYHLVVLLLEYRADLDWTSIMALWDKNKEVNGNWWLCWSEKRNNGTDCQWFKRWIYLMNRKKDGVESADERFF